MFDKTFFLILGIVISVVSTACAKEENPIFTKLESGSISIGNPFEPQLPIKEPEKIDTPAPIENIPKSASDPYFFAEKRPQIVTPPPVEIRPLPIITISGIIWNSDRPQAIINQTIVDIGDTILEITITDIQKTSISGTFDGRAVTLKP